MKLNKIILIAAIIIFIIIFLKLSKLGKTKEVFTISEVKRSDITISINATGTVLPQNRLIIKPPLSGRIENIVVKEGDYVKKGQILLYMSSSDRAAILDAARARGENLKEWEEIYKPIPVVAPINGQVIVRGIEEGQTVTQSDSLLVLSDRLIVKVQVDETDIGKVKKGQEAIITLDAYPDDKIRGIVDHIYYESKQVNNVTIYEVDVLPEKVPDFLRSGMNASVDIIQIEKKDTLVIPANSVKGDRQGNNYVIVLSNKNKREKRVIKTGVSDGEVKEVLEGLNDGEKIVIIKQEFLTKNKKSESTTNPFVPQRPRRIR